MKTEFQRLNVQNFKCFEDLELDLTEFPIGLHFIQGRNLDEPRLGSNGAGKSSIWESMCWSLYGRTPAGLKNPDIAPWSGAKPSMVAVDVLVDDKAYKILRTANPNKLAINDKTCGQEDVINLIGLNYDIFVNTVLLGQGRPLFFDRPPNEKMQLFTDVLDLNRWDERSVKAQKRVQELETDLSTVKGEEVGVSNQIDLVNEMLKTAQKQSAEWEEERAERVEKSKAELANLEKKLESQRLKLNRAELNYDKAMTEIKALENDVAKRQSDLDAARSAYNKAEIELDLCQNEIDELTQEISTLGEDGKCPTCGQSIKGTSLDVHKKKLTSQLKEMEARVKKGIPREIVDAVVTNETKTSTDRAHVANFKLESETARQSIEFLQPEVIKIEENIKHLNATLTEGEEDENPYHDQLSKLKRKRTALVNEKEDIAKDIRILSKKIERSKFWVKGFKDIRLYIIEEVLQELELTTQALLEEAGLVGWKVEYVIEKETKSGTVQRAINVLIESPKSKRPVRWEAWSGGEGQRLRLVGALALSEVLLNYAGVDVDLEILDEPTRGLSQEGVADLCDLLADHAKRLERLTFYVDHNAVESSKFTSTMLVERGDKGSKVA